MNSIDPGRKQGSCWNGFIFQRGTFLGGVDEREGNKYIVYRAIYQQRPRPSGTGGDTTIGLLIYQRGRLNTVD